MPGLQPAKWRAVAVAQLQLRQCPVPVAQAGAVQCFARRRWQQPDSGGAGRARQFAEQPQAAAVRRAAWVAGDQQACRGKATELIEQLLALLTAVDHPGIAY